MVQALGESGVYVSMVDCADGGTGAERYEALQRPILPAVELDGELHSIHHPSQVAVLLGLDVTVGASSSVAVAWDIHGLMDLWLEIIDVTSFEAMLEPTRSRDRSVRNLVVNVFRPISYVPDAWRIGEFVWYTGDADLQQEALLRDHRAVAGFARDIWVAYGSFLLDDAGELDERNPPVTSNLGDMTFQSLLVAQRFHAAFHYRQVRDHLQRSGCTAGTPISPALAKAIGLPSGLY